MINVISTSPIHDTAELNSVDKSRKGSKENYLLKNSISNAENVKTNCWVKLRLLNDPHCLFSTVSKFWPNVYVCQKTVSIRFDIVFKIYNGVVFIQDTHSFIVIGLPEIQLNNSTQWYRPSQASVVMLGEGAAGLTCTSTIEFMFQTSVNLDSLMQSLVSNFDTVWYCGYCMKCLNIPFKKIWDGIWTW